MERCLWGPLIDEPDDRRLTGIDLAPGFCVHYGVVVDRGDRLPLAVLFQTFDRVVGVQVDSTFAPGTVVAVRLWEVEGGWEDMAELLVGDEWIASPLEVYPKRRPTLVLPP